MVREITSRISIIDNHDEAYHLWKALGLTNLAVVHVDAHHDMVQPDGTSVPTISDYLRWAIREGIAREVVWAVPDPAWSSKSQRRAILGHLKALSRTEGGRRCRFYPKQRLGHLSLYGRPVRVCSLETIGEVDPPLVLDVDTDYLLLEQPTTSAWHHVPSEPWIWPAEVAARLREVSNSAQLVTICYSIMGGYNPIMWKHLGDDLARILAADRPDDEISHSELKRRMAEAFLDEDMAEHEELRRTAEHSRPDDASLHHWRALALARSGDVERAREAQARAIELDTSYARSYGCCGPVYEAGRDYEVAQMAYELATVLNQNDPIGWYGLGRIALRGGDASAARVNLEKAAALPDAPAEVHRELGALNEAEGRFDDAVSEYRKYLRLAFAGRSFDVPPTAVRDPQYRSMFWADGYSGLARSYAARGNSHASANCYAQALRLSSPSLYLAAGPILRRMAGAADLPATTVAASVIRSLRVGLGLAARQIFRGLIRFMTGAGLVLLFDGRPFPPVRLRRSRDRAEHSS